MTNLQDILDTAIGTWRLAPDRSTVTFRTKTAWGLATVTGAFTEVSGEGVAADDVTGRVVVKAASVQTGIGRRDKHLRSPDFFDVERHPDIVVTVHGAESAVEHTAVLHATLAIRGTARPLELPVDVQVLDHDGVQLASDVAVDRAAFGVTGNLLGMVGPVAEVSATLVFVRF